MSAAVSRTLGALFALGLTTLGASAEAQFCRTKACDDQPAYDDVWQEEPDATCERDRVGCLLDGKPLYWKQRCISYSVQRDGSGKQEIDYELAHATIERAFQSWMDADCGDGATPSFVMADYSPAVCSEVEYNQDSGNANVFTFRDDKWPHIGAEDTLALTTITYNTETAQIYDADVEINSADAEFTFADDEASTNDDMLAVLTHECGHFLGLSHDQNQGSTMFWQYFTGDLYQRTLHADDVAGICEIYPPNQPIDANSCEPRHGFSRECGSSKESGGCALGKGRSGGGAAAALLVAFGLVLRRRRAR